MNNTDKLIAFLNSLSNTDKVIFRVFAYGFAFLLLFIGLPSFFELVSFVSFNIASWISQ